MFAASILNFQLFAMEVQLGIGGKNFAKDLLQFIISGVGLISKTKTIDIV